jgi:hypothetical protein
MSQSAVAEILQRAKINEKFRKMLLAEPMDILSRFDLTKVEIDMIRALTEKELVDDGEGGTNDYRGGFIPGGGG